MLTSVVTVCGFQAKRTAESQGHFTLAWMSLPSLLGVLTEGSRLSFLHQLDLERSLVL